MQEAWGSSSGASDSEAEQVVKVAVLAGSALALSSGAMWGCHKPLGHGEISPEASGQTAQKNESAPGMKDDYWEHTKTVFRVPIGNSPGLGSPDAPVTIVEFADFQCSPCGQVEPTLKALRGKYGNKIRIVWKHELSSSPLAAEAAAEAALEVRAEKGDDAFWVVHDAFFARQEALAAGTTPNISAIVNIAREAGATSDKIKGAITGRAHAADIETDLDLGEDLDNKGALHFFVNGRRLEGAPPQERFEKMIDEELQRAEILMARGVRPSDVYDELVRNGRGPWPPELKDVPRSLPTNDPVLGRANADVTIHVWSDYQCALCVAVERTMAQLAKDYRDRIKFVWHDLPLPRHADAQMVARAGREAYAEKGTHGFWAIHDEIFNHPRRVTRDDLDAFAREMNLDSSKWNAAMEGRTRAAEIEADEKAAADDGITETPAYLVVPGTSPHGYFVDATQDMAKLRRLVERALSEIGSSNSSKMR
jgi:protein-disulfide isomerase